jgi:hypothetical protein
VGFDVEGFGSNGRFEDFGGFMFSTNGSYHFKNVTSSGKLVPFGTAGFSAVAVCSDECGGTAGLNFGGGLNYWFRPNRGLRLEIRDHMVDDFTSHKWEARIGPQTTDHVDFDHSKT